MTPTVKNTFVPLKQIKDISNIREKKVVFIELCELLHIYSYSMEYKYGKIIFYFCTSHMNGMVIGF